MPTDDYIKRSDALKAIRYENWREENRVPSIEGLHLTKYQLLAKAINDIHAADVEPVVHGRWVSKEGIYGVVYCSICDFELKIDNTLRCPNCGSRMLSELPKGEDDAEVH